MPLSQDELILLAGEYALGVLDGDDRERFEQALRSDPQAQKALRGWETQFESLNGEYEEIQPPADVLAAIQQKLPQQTDTNVPTASVSSSQALMAVNDDEPASSVLGKKFWQGYSALATAAAAGLAFVSFSGGQVAPVQLQYAPITLTAQSATNAAVFAYNAKAEALELRAHTFTHPESTDLEAWLIIRDGNPQSLGVLAGNSDGEIVIKLPKGARDLLASGAVLAITQEPKGGAPQGIPTGPRLASGEIRVS